MIRVLFFLLVLLSSVAIAQTEEQPKALKIDEFERATNGYVKMKMDYFYSELSNDPPSQGYIINYGTDREIITREKQIRVSMQWRRFDPARITLVRGGFREEVKTELWIVPPGADDPQPESKAQKFDEFGKIPAGDLKARIDNLYNSLGNNPELRGVILIYGTAKTISAQEARIKTLISFRKFDSSLITFKNAGFKDEIKTEFWLVPASAKNDVKTKIWIVPPGAKLPKP